jgi:GT2 family glycosyltransferase
MTLSDPRPDISILIVSWNTRLLTETCLNSLPASVAAETTYETIVVDNNSTDGSLALLRGRADIDLVANDENVGYAKAVNQCFSRARGRLILLLNSDIEFKPGSLGELVRFLDERPSVAGVGPLYLNPDGTEQQHHYRLPTFGALLGSYSSVLRKLPVLSSRYRDYRMLDEDFTRPRRVEQPSASVLLIRREALPDQYLLDEQFPIYYNDVELAYRLDRRGLELWMTPASQVFHVHGASTRQLGPSLRRQHLASLVRYLELTQPTRRLVAFKAFVCVQKLFLRALRRPDALSVRDVILSLKGDPGSLPQSPRTSS